MLAMVLCPAPTWAGRPLVTEDAADVLEPGQCELEAYAARLTGEALSYQWGQLSCGTGWHTQAGAGVGREDGPAGRDAIAAIGGKTSLRKLTDDQAGIAIAYAALGGTHRDHARHEASEIKVAVTVPRNQWLLHANLGLVRSYASHTDKTIWALALERRNAFGPVDLMGELVGDDRGGLLAQAAARWALVPERCFLDASWGTQIHDRKSHQATLGFKLAF